MGPPPRSHTILTLLKYRFRRLCSPTFCFHPFLTLFLSFLLSLTVSNSSPSVQGTPHSFVIERTSWLRKPLTRRTSAYVVPAKCVLWGNPGANTSLQNLSFILNKPLDVEFAERPKPQIEDPHHVLVAVNYTGICGSDVHYYTHGSIGPFVVKDPMVLGHESSGTVVEIGDKVTTLKRGDRVALEPGYNCRRCKYCHAGKYNLCPDLTFAATPPHHGTLTGLWAAPEDFCYKLPDSVSLQEGALIEPLAVAVHIVKQADVRPGQSVVVMGAGPVGLLCAAVAKAFGASKIVSVDIVQSKLDFAKDFAATHTYASQRVSPEENAQSIKDQFDMPEGADVVVDATGVAPSIQTSLHLVRMGGSYVQGGMGASDITFPIMALCQKEVTAKGSFRYGPGDYSLAIDLVSSGKVLVKKLASEVVAFDKAEEAFNKVRGGQVIKILIAGPNEKTAA